MFNYEAERKNRESKTTIKPKPYSPIPENLKEYEKELTGLRQMIGSNKSNNKIGDVS